MFQPKEYIHKIHNLEHGSARLDLISQAIQEADDASEHYWRLYFRYEYIRESTMHGDNFKGLLCFPEYLKIFDEHPEYDDDMYQDMMWAFKWLIGYLDDYYQISLEQVKHYFEEFKKRSEKYGFSLRTYYMKQATFWKEVDRTQTDIAFEKFQKYSRNQNSDCEACELNFSMGIYLDRGEEEKALEMIQPVLQHEKRCGEIPHVTYAKLAEYYFWHDNPAEALYYANLCQELIQNQAEFLREMGVLLEIYSVLDANQGWKVFKYNLQNFVNCRNPKMRMLFARGAWRLLNVIAKEVEFSKSPLLNILPVAHTADGWNMQELCKYFYEIALDIAQKLDNRNQIPHFVPALERTLPEYNAQTTWEETAKSARGLIPKARTQMLIFLNQQVTQEMLQKRIEEIKPFSCSCDKDGNFATLQTEETLLDFIFLTETPVPSAEDLSIMQGIEEEQLLNLLQSPSCCAMATEISGEPQKAYHYIMKFLSQIFPDMTGILNLSALRAYSTTWVKFAGQYENAVAPYQLYSIHFQGSEETGEVSGITVGLNAFGLRELEFAGATIENYAPFANIFEDIASLCVERNHLPDENQTITQGRNQETHEEFNITWKKWENSSEENALNAVLNLDEIPEIETLQLRISQFRYLRGIRLTEETIEIFQNAIQKPFLKALVRVGVELSEEMQEEYDYEFEPLWAEISPQDKTISLLQTSESVPEYHEGDKLEIELNADTVYDWRIQLHEDEDMLTPEEGYLLMEDKS